MASPRVSPVVEQITLLRFLVAFLGEKKQFAWWNSSFLSSTGLSFLAHPFPRTALSAAFYSASEAARILHDTRIGKVGVFHLFRFPAEQEDSVQGGSRLCLDPKWPDELFNRERALAKPATLANQGSPRPPAPSPSALSQIASALRPSPKPPAVTTPHSRKTPLLSPTSEADAHARSTPLHDPAQGWFGHDQ